MYDQVGCGLSERLKDPGEYSVYRHSDDLKEIIKKVSSDKVILVGQSWGGFLATYFTTCNPELVDKLILTSPGGIEPQDSLITKKYTEIKIRGLTNISNRIERINDDISTKLSLREKIWLALGTVTKSPLLISDNKVDGVLHHTSKLFVKGMVCDSLKAKEPKGRPGMYCAIFTNKSMDKIPSNIRKKIKNIDKKVLILKGECDYIDWQETYEYVDLMPNAELKIIKNAGHSILNENNDIYKREILDFLN